MEGAKRLLVVDDEPNARALVAKFMADEGFEVVQAENAAIALAALLDGGVDAVVTDIRMPGDDGIALFEHIQKYRPGVPVIFISGNAEKAQCNPVLSGKVPFLAKPFTRRMLAETVRAALVRAVPTRPQPVRAPTRVENHGDAKPLILVVEDSKPDKYLIEHALEESRVGAALHFVPCGAEATGWLEARLAAGEPLPRLVLLDLRLPDGDGVDWLTRYIANPALRAVPVVVFSGSNCEEDVQRAYRAGASGYFAKPVQLEAYLRIVSDLLRYWTQAKPAAISPAPSA